MEPKKSSTEIKRDRQKAKILESLADNGIVRSACKKAGISPDTYYRWREMDRMFFEDTIEAIDLGNKSINELARIRLFQNIDEGKMDAIKYQLSKRDPDYMPQPPPRRPEDVYVPVDVIEVYDAPTREELEARINSTGPTGPIGPASDTVLSHQV